MQCSRSTFVKLEDARRGGNRREMAFVLDADRNREEEEKLPLYIPPEYEHLYAWYDKSNYQDSHYRRRHKRSNSLESSPSFARGRNDSTWCKTLANNRPSLWCQSQSILQEDPALDLPHPMCWVPPVWHPPRFDPTNQQEKDQFVPAIQMEIKPRRVEEAFTNDAPRSSRTHAQPKYVSTRPSTTLLNNNLDELWKDDLLLSSRSPLEDLLYYRDLRRKKDFEAAWNAFPSTKQEDDSNNNNKGPSASPCFAHSRSARSFYTNPVLSPTKNKHSAALGRLGESSISTESGWTEPSSELGDSALLVKIPARKTKRRQRNVPPETTTTTNYSMGTTTRSKRAQRLEPPGRHSRTLMRPPISGATKNTTPLEARRSRLDEWQREYLTTTKTTGGDTTSSVEALSHQYDQQYSRVLKLQDSLNRPSTIRGYV